MLLKIKSDKERQEIARHRGGFDDSWIDKKTIKQLRKPHFCFYCHKPLEPIIDNINKTGTITMSCNTQGCIGNANEDIKSIDPIYRNLARHIDRKPVSDLNQLLYGRSPTRLLARRNIIF
jgi:hypothetical protein